MSRRRAETVRLYSASISIEMHYFSLVALLLGFLLFYRYLRTRQEQKVRTADVLFAEPEKLMHA